MLTAAETAETYGWDTVFATHIADANAAIARAGTSPPSFEAADAADGYSAAGTFGAWAISPGGSGDLVRLALPIEDVVIEEPGGASETVAGTALVDVRLNLLDGDEDAAGAGTNKLLRVQSTPTAQGESVASVVKIEYADPAPSFMGDAALQALLGQWLNENLVDFDHVFATINIDRTADTGDFQWMQPTHVSYAYTDLGSGTEGGLAVLCMTQDRAPSGLVQQVSGTVIPDGQRAGFLVSKERMLANLMLPSMPHVFPGSAVTDYALSASGDSIVLASTSVGFTFTAPAHGDDPPQDYRASLVDLELTIEGTELQLDVTTVTTLSPGIRAFCQTQSFLGMKLVDKSDGTQTLGYFDSRPAITRHWPDVDKGIEITEEILGFIAIIIAVIATVISGGAAIGVAALIIGLVVGVMGLTVDLIEDVGKDDGPSIGSLVLDSTAAITWPDSQDFDLTCASLSDSLQMGGVLVAG